MLKVAFIGAGGRAQGAHYPNVHRLPDVSIEAVAELNPQRMQTVVQRYGIPRAYDDYNKMLKDVDLDAVYVIMGENYVTRPALDCISAGKHVFIEKPPGANADEAQQLLDAALAQDVYCAVGYQRRYAAVTREAMRLAQEHGGATLAVGEFHKCLIGSGPTLWNDVTHVVDLVRYMMQSEVEEVCAFRQSHRAPWMNYHAIIRFAGAGIGIITGNRSSGGRVLRAELHAVGLGCFLRLPEQIEIHEQGKGSRTLSGAEAGGADPRDVDAYEGVLAMHQHFADCIRTREVPISDIRDAVHTARLVAQIQGDT
jgi:predicted dehydrogenase